MTESRSAKRKNIFLILKRMNAKHRIVALKKIQTEPFAEKNRMKMFGIPLNIKNVPP